MKKKTQINKIINKKGGIVTDTTEIQRVIRGYYVQVYTNKLNNPEGMQCTKIELERNRKSE